MSHLNFDVAPIERSVREGRFPAGSFRNRVIAIVLLAVSSFTLVTACTSSAETADALPPGKPQEAVIAPVPQATARVTKDHRTKDVMPLKEAFKGRFLIGSALNYPELQGKNPERVAFVRNHFNAITAGNSMKPDFTQRVEGQFTFADGDKLVEIAAQSRATVVGHTLVWHSQTPDWFFKAPDGKPADRTLALVRMRKHISTVVGRYKGRIKQWDVVNEAISDSPDEDLRQTPWLKAVGPDYIEQAFRAAHEADPDAVLIYNDYNIEREYKRPKALRLLKSLIAKGVPVHAVGIQCHWRLDNPDFAEVEESIKQFSQLGLKVMITELDIGVLPTKYQGADVYRTEVMTPEMQATMNPYTGGLPDAVAQQHAERYRQAFEMFLRHQDKIGRVTFWGVDDEESWFNDFPIKGRTDYPLLFDRHRNPKPAYFAVVKTVSSEKP